MTTPARRAPPAAPPLPDRVLHLAEAANWPSIRRDGLLTAARLIERSGADAERLGRAQRRHHTVLPDGREIRDQRPMAPGALARCLVGATPEQWYAEVNSRVFFWLDPARLERHRRACAPRPQVVLVVDTAALLAAHGDRAALTPVNTGNTRRRPAPRSPATFVPWSRWRVDGWASEAAALGTRPRPRSHRPVELTVRGDLPDLAELLVEVRELPP